MAKKKWGPFVKALAHLYLMAIGYKSSNWKAATFKVLHVIVTTN